MMSVSIETFVCYFVPKAEWSGGTRTPSIARPPPPITKLYSVFSKNPDRIIRGGQAVSAFKNASVGHLNPEL